MSLNNDLTQSELELVHSEIIGAIQTKHGMSQDARLPLYFRELYSMSANSLFSA
jgi:hypothetical protein